MSKAKIGIMMVGMSMLIACQDSENTAPSGNSSQLPAGREGLERFLKPGMDPADYYSHLPDSMRALIDSVRLLASESERKVVSLPRGAAKSAAQYVNVEICTAINYGGTCWSIDRPLDYNDLRFVNPLGNDVVSSIRVYAGSIWICDANNWGGPCYNISVSTPDLRYLNSGGSNVNFNDRTSSFKFAQSADANAAVIYDSQNYGAGTDCILYHPFDYNYPPCNMNDKTSSIRYYLPNPGAGFWYKAFDTASFQGTGKWLETDLPNLFNVGLDNKISSFQWSDLLN